MMKYQFAGNRFTALEILLLICMAVSAPTAWGELPPMTQQVAVHKGTIEVEAGQTWTKQIALPVLAQDERPVLALRARLGVPGKGGGCNYMLQVLINDLPLTENIMRLRLLNKAPWFDPPNTQYHFQWYSATQQGWMTIFSNGYELNWGGTGRDFDFLFDLTGYVVGGESFNLGFRYLNPQVQAALKLQRAPLVLDDVVIGAMKKDDVERLRTEAMKGLRLTRVPVNPKLPSDAKPGDRAYEIEWAGRKESPPAQVAFEDLHGWTLDVLSEAKVSLAASIEHLLWRKQTAKLCYIGEKAISVMLRPPAPIHIPEKFDAANLWVYGAIDRYKDRHPRFTALLEDAAGLEFAVDLGPLRSCYWNLLHGVLPAEAARRIKFPIKFTALSMDAGPVPAERSIYLESLAFYQQNRKPFAKMDNSKRSIFPTSDDGMLPTPPKNVKVSIKASKDGAEFVSEASEGTLRFRVRPVEGCLHGITAQWKDGTLFRPMDGGGVLLDFGDGERLPTGAKIVSSAMDGERLIARWRLEQEGMAVEWSACYALRGRTLVVDLKSEGGAATGLAFGQVAGLPNPRGIEVPYLKMCGPKPGPWFACAGGLFVSVLPDWYHSDFSMVDATVTPPTADRIGLLKGTVYKPLTDRRRNNLRERVLITVSPEFADTLPNARNPVSPNRERLAPYMFFMGSAASQNFYATLKRYGIDYVIACDFASVLVDDYAEGFAMRWRPHPLLTYQQVREMRQGIKSLGYLFGFYLDATDYFPGNEWFDENKVALTSTGDMVDSWYGNFAAKPNAMPLLVRLTGEMVKEHYPPDCVYLDVHTNRDLAALDYEAGVEGAGMARPQVLANADCILEARQWYGSTMSEGICRWLYAGVCDMDYATLVASKPAPEIPPLVDFDLLKIHPFEHGTMMGYAPSAFFGKTTPTDLSKDPGRGIPPTDFYKYFSASLAYGHMLILGYGYIPPMARFIHCYALMQGVQREYLTDNVAEIHYHNGSEFLTTSRALMEDSQKLGRVRVRYSRGLIVHVNYNEEKPWTIEWEGRRYELPPYGWLIVKPGEVLAYSALINGKRADFVQCPEYIYLNTGDARVSEGPLEVEGAVWLKRVGKSWRLIPCGALGSWKSSKRPGMTKYCIDYELVGLPDDRGCKHIVLDTNALLGRPAAQVRVTARDSSQQSVEAGGQTADTNRLMLSPSEGVVDYLLE